MFAFVERRREGLTPPGGTQAGGRADNPLPPASNTVYPCYGKRSLVLPDAPAVVAGHGRAAIFIPDGELFLLTASEAAVRNGRRTCCNRS
jgi:hypothetical protein